MHEIESGNWKVRRELRRIAEQLHLPIRQMIDSVRRAHYERNRHALCQVSRAHGNFLRTRIAIFLIHQPDGLSPSTLHTCRHLRDNGFSCVAVANGGLSEPDRQSLLRETDVVITRPNFGYDFGGYQEGIRWLREQSIDPESLLLLNDSVWFPVLRSSDFLQRMLATDADLVGALSAENTRNPKYRHRGRFFASFMLLFSSGAWRSERFQRFWQCYKASDSKRQTIRNGERALSKLFVEQPGFRCHAMVDASNLESLVDRCNAEALIPFTCSLSIANPVLRQKLSTLLADRTSRDQASFRDWFGEVASSENLLFASLAPAVRHLRLPFIKKSAERHNVLSVQRTLPTLAALPDIDETALAEIWVRFG
jgi:hypothetical protein